jgi:hypothetical protein
MNTRAQAEMPKESQQEPSGGLSLAYGSKEDQYFSTARRSFVDVLPQNPTGRLLEVGWIGTPTTDHTAEPHTRERLSVAFPGISVAFSCH